MKIKSVINILGALLIFLSLSLLACLYIAIFFEEKIFYWIISVILPLVFGAIFYKTTSVPEDINTKEGFAIVTLGWVFLSLFGALPFFISNTLPNFIDAFFETMSGFTTTGATVIQDIEKLPKSLLFWRSLTHWYGGMGIIVLSLALFPLMKKIGGMQLFKAEVPGISNERLVPKIATTAKYLWTVYLLLSLLEILFLYFGGMSLFESFCHTFGTMATGGFSTKNGSIGYYNSIYIETVITIFMFLAGVNFSLHYQLLKGDIKSYFKDKEFIFYTSLIFSAIALITLVNLSYYGSLSESFRFSSFQVISITTTTGYCTADFDKWPVFCKLLLVVLMFVGGCAGSTGGGMKNIRVMILLKKSFQEIKKIIYPQAVFPLRFGTQVIPPDTATTVLAFFILYMFIFVICSLLMSFLGLDLITAVSSVVATLGNIGPGLVKVGASQTYAHLPYMGKIILSFCMLVGRLEIYTVLVLFLPLTWKN